ncbi:HofP DNA utilization family protein [Yokenella regensburgei]|uniref:HofP DNA utilization family protein n=1 Tax=Yokenella regensburgei TaxID=158877 RepID=UPI003F5CE423
MADKSSLTVCLLMLPLILGMRDPFQPVPDRCLFSQQSLWQLQGAVTINGQSVGLVRDPTGRWHRLREGDRLFANWRVVRLNKEEAILENGDGCSPDRWHLKREGTQNDKTHGGHAVPLHPDARSAREGEREIHRQSDTTGNAYHGRRASSAGAAGAG